MKIIRLKLVNFAAVYAGLNKTEVEIDLSNVNERINLFVGANGSGKSSILRSAHPFAYNNSVGVSVNNADVILENMDGRKELDIVDHNIIYKIQHLYTRQKNGNITVKSFISLNGKELNENGTTTNFKSVVMEYLGIDDTFLTLLSIGNSIDGFVEFTASDRKVFISKIFSELDIYSMYYKSMTTLAKDKKALLGNVLDKLKRYKGISKEDLVIEFNENLKNLKSLERTKSELLKNIGGCQTTLLTNKDTITEYDEIQHAIMNNIDLVRGLQYKIHNPSNDINQLKDMELSMIQKITDLTSSIAVNESLINGYQSDINSKIDRIQSITLTLDKYVSGEDLTELENLLSTIDGEIHKIEETIGNNKLPKELSADTFIKAGIYLDEINRICNGFLYDITNMKIVPIIYEEYKKSRQSIYDRINERFASVSTNLHNLNIVKFTNIDMDTNIGKIDCKEKACPYKLFYDTYISFMTQSQQENDIKKDILDEEYQTVSDGLTVIGILDKIFDKLTSWENTFKYIPKEIFDPNTFIDQYLDDRTIYDERLLARYVETLENISKLENLEAKREAVQIKLESGKSNIDTYLQLKKEKESLTVEIDGLNDSIENLVNQIKSEKEKLNLSEQALTNVREDINILTRIAELKEEEKNNIQKSQSMQRIMEEIKIVQDKLDEYNHKIIEIESMIYNLSESNKTIEMYIHDINRLESEEIDIRDSYDEIVEIRKAVSPTTGIPVEFIEYYFKVKMVNKMNQLLDSVFHGNLRIIGDEVVVNDKEFTIPYMKNNTFVKDISKASDGERAILTFAFSLVLIESSIQSDKYNIMLLDEPDTALDHYKRSKFIDLIETFMELIGSEQLWLISHNNMFDSYPVHVLMTSEMNISNMTNVTVDRLYG